MPPGRNRVARPEKMGGWRTGPSILREAARTDKSGAGYTGADVGHAPVALTSRAGLTTSKSLATRGRYGEARRRASPRSSHGLAHRGCTRARAVRASDTFPSGWHPVGARSEGVAAMFSTRSARILGAVSCAGRLVPGRGTLVERCVAPRSGSGFRGDLRRPGGERLSPHPLLRNRLLDPGRPEAG